jgi:ribosomal protein S18 acetylase RimI-like enzyme
MEALSIRAATVEDIDALVALGRQTFIETYKGMGDPRPDGLEEQYGLETFTVETLGPALECFDVATVNGVPTGFLRVDVEGDAAQITKAYVLKAFKGRGIGSQFVARAKERALRAGCARLWLSVYNHNTAAIGFYRKMGFVETGTQAWTFIYKGMPYFDTDIVMSMALGDI